MTKIRTKRLWQKIAEEMHKLPNWDKIKINQKDYKTVVSLRGLLFECRSILEKIELGYNVGFNVLIFNKSMDFYCKEIKKYG